MVIAYLGVIANLDFDSGEFLASVKNLIKLI